MCHYYFQNLSLPREFDAFTWHVILEDMSNVVIEAVCAVADKKTFEPRAAMTGHRPVRYLGICVVCCAQSGASVDVL